MKKYQFIILVIVCAILCTLGWFYYDFQREKGIILFEEAQLSIVGNNKAICALGEILIDYDKPDCCHWEFVTDAAVKNEVENRLQISLPKTDFSKHWMIISYGHPLKKLSYHLFDEMMDPYYKYDNYWEGFFTDLRERLLGDWPDQKNILFKKAFSPRTYYIYKTNKLNNDIRARLERTNQLYIDLNVDSR